MAVREIVHIDEELCDGCGLCVPSCAEHAIQVINGKARLLAENLCDGLGACLGKCPQDAIIIEKREADEYDEAVVAAHIEAIQSVSPATTETDRCTASSTPAHPAGASGCPGSRVMQFGSDPGVPDPSVPDPAIPVSSELRQWPVQLHLLPPNAPFFSGADVLLAADCSAFAVPDFHQRYLKGKAVAVACPKLDQGQEIYLQKLQAMIDTGGINTLNVLIMQVPCCSGLIGLAVEAARRAERKVPIKQIVVDLQGEVIHEAWC